ncbi:hypothetical protein GCM10023149_40020 [Mucilaginibacter gynuensis]|uniref:GtrA/DPMS transmembrane domain-containing protein n=1 Tax=Mucilaginibacter gynuensis TaxID=1302236 RepID=A0ABP8H2A8_9SPHI
MATFIKAQASSLIASVIDYLTTVVCNEVFHVWYLYSNFTGTVMGGVANFALGRFWVFDGKKKNAPTQIIKYIVVWIGNLILNNGGVFLATHFGGLDKYISKIIVSLVVGIGYNYFLQKKFVFA